MSEQEKFVPEGEEAPEEEIKEAAGQETQSEAEEAPKNEETEKDEKDMKIKKLEKQLEEQKDQYLRTVAEYDNYRKRTAREKTEAYGDASAKTVAEFLSVIDNFERAMMAETADEKFKSGIQMIFNQYLDILKKLGVEEIKAEGEPFNPQYHHAVQQIEDEELGENVVAAVLQKGYILGDRIIRPAMVTVANP